MEDGNSPSKRSTAAHVLADIVAHRSLIREHIEYLVMELRIRGERHDRTKLSPEEFAGFSELGEKEHAVDSPEYRDRLTADCIQTHWRRNSHHPEYHHEVGDMGWLDIIEMVIDWKVAAESAGSSLQASADRLISKHAFRTPQEWLIRQVIAWLNAQGDHPMSHHRGGDRGTETAAPTKRPDEQRS